jgi:tRNA(fMet)-specific endonuclease VapC
MKPTDTRAKIYKPHVDGKLIAVCFITIGEMHYGAAKRGWDKSKVDDLNKRLRSAVIVPFDFKMCTVFGDLKARLSKIGRTVETNDLWIAACAVRHSIPLISHNRSHYEGIPGLVLISEAPVIAEIQSQTEFEGMEKGKKATTDEG